MPQQEAERKSDARGGSAAAESRTDGMQRSTVKQLKEKLKTQLEQKRWAIMYSFQDPDMFNCKWLGVQSKPNKQFKLK